MYWIGWQGAIFGPLMLCFFIGLFEVATLAMRTNQEPRYVRSRLKEALFLFVCKLSYFIYVDNFAAEEYK